MLKSLSPTVVEGISRTGRLGPVGEFGTIGASRQMVTLEGHSVDGRQSTSCANAWLSGGWGVLPLGAGSVSREIASWGAGS